MHNVNVLLKYDNLSVNKYLYYTIYTLKFKGMPRSFKLLY